MALRLIVAQMITLCLSSHLIALLFVMLICFENTEIVGLLIIIDPPVGFSYNP